MLTETACSIAPSFIRLLKLSLSTATVPKCWKQANVLFLFKKRDGSDFGNYRPVSLILIFAQMYEISPEFLGKLYGQDLLGIPLHYAHRSLFTHRYVGTPSSMKPM